MPEVDSPKLVGMAVYTDWGILRPGRYELVGSQNERNAKITQQNLDGSKLVTVEGQLKDKESQPCGLRYRVVYRLEDDKLAMDISLIAEKDFASMHGFLATVFNFVGANEWFALTKKGWVFSEIAYDGRVFQSSQTPLDDQKPIVGIANSKTVWAIMLALKRVEPEESVDNVLIHANPQGSGGIFIAWCDGISARRMSKGETWQVSLTAKFVRLDELGLLEW